MLDFLLKLRENTVVLAMHSYYIIRLTTGFYKGNAAESKITPSLLNSALSVLSVIIIKNPSAE